MLPLETHHIRGLANVAEQAINRTLEEDGPRSPRPTGEVSAVRKLVLDGFDEIAHAWEPLLRRWSLRIELSAIFTHSRPHVTFTPTRYTRGAGRCELADLLVVVDHQDYGGVIQDRRAALVQAKRLKGREIKLSGGEWTQHELLLELPAFSFVDPIYAPGPRDIRTAPQVGDPDFTAEYGGVEVDGMPRHWTFWIPAAPDDLTAPLALGTWLARMAAGLSMTGRMAKPHGTDDWSATVEELLRVTGALPIVMSDDTILRKNSNVVGRVADTASYLSVPTGLSAAGGPRKPEMEDYWPEGPISTVHLTFRQVR